jgi:peroxiredoxin
MHAYRDQYAQIFNLGQNVVLIGISADTPEDLASWAHDDDFQFLMASDRDLKVGTMYGALSGRGGTNRNLFVVGPDGRIAYRATPFREIDPTAYADLGAAIKKLLPEPVEEQ